MRYLLFQVAFLSSFYVLADNLNQNYYGSEFITGYQNKTLNNEDLKNLLFNILKGGHVKHADLADEIVPSCASALKPPGQDQPACKEHIALGYDRARIKLFGQIHLRQNTEGTYYVKDVYCERDFTDADFGGNPTFGPQLKPISGDIINTEHTWPQSRFTSRFPRDVQKSDLHHLFPTDSQMNSKRSSLRFGYVSESSEPLKCPQNKLGHQAAGGEIIFEVADSQKGNTARAIFYFATRYQMKISLSEETALREWNKRDPVDTEELDRNNQVEVVQGNRNPYVDYSDLLERIDHF